MEAKETVMNINAWLDRNGIDRAYKKDMKPTYEKIKGDFEAQAEISFKAGIREVVGDFETVLDAPAHYRLEMFFDVLNTWQAQLKEWGIRGS